MIKIFQMKIAIKIFLLFFYCGVWSQTNGIVKKGLVLNKKDSLGIPYTNVYSDVYKIGAVSNELGEYLLNIPNTISNKVITFSSLGYLSKKIAIEKIRDTIFLIPSTEQLNEILISSNKPNIENILNKVFKNLKNNYSNKRHLLNGFYRQTSIRDSMYVKIIESDISIQEYGIAKQLDRDRIKVNHYRRSDDIQSSWQKKFIKAVTNILAMNEMVWLKKNDFVKNFAKVNDSKFYRKKILKNFIFEYNSKTYINNEAVYIFDFYPKKLENIYISDNDLSKIYINSKDYAIIKVVWKSLIKKYDSYIPLSKNIINYAKIGNYYYLTNSSRFSKYKKEFINHWMYIYEVKQDRKDYLKIKRREAENAYQNFGDRKYKYDAVFWDNYKILPLIPINKKMKKLIEAQNNLDNQYKKNSDEE
jgi:hypothetical protein